MLQPRTKDCWLQIAEPGCSFLNAGFNEQEMFFSLVHVKPPCWGLGNLPKAKTQRHRSRPLQTGSKTHGEVGFCTTYSSANHQKKILSASCLFVALVRFHLEPVMDPKYVTLTIKQIKFNDVQRGFFLLSSVRGVPKGYIEPTRANEIRITQMFRV